jgi:hypothetical protein
MRWGGMTRAGRPEQALGQGRLCVEQLYNSGCPDSLPELENPSSPCSREEVPGHGTNIADVRRPSSKERISPTLHSLTVHAAAACLPALGGTVCTATVVGCSFGSHTALRGASHSRHKIQG